MKHIVCNALTVGLMLAASSASFAQTAAPAAKEPMGVFVNVNGGAQAKERTLTTSLEFPLYDQTASLAAAQNVGRGGIFDINAGYTLGNLPFALFEHPLWNNVAVGLGVTTYSKTGQIVGAASIPHPLFLNRHQTTEITADSKRTERSVYIQAVWFTPLSRFSSMPMLKKVDLALSIGPSFINVEQDVLVSAAVPAGTQQATADIQRRSDSTVGVILGADLTYLVTPMIGGGAFVRYQGGGGVDLSPAEKQSTGGVQAGVGLRLRF